MEDPLFSCRGLQLSDIKYHALNAVFFFNLFADKNECNEESSCPLDHSYCINLKGSYNCTCKNGFKNLYDSKNRLKKCTGNANCF